MDADAVRWGILGAARIADGAVIPALRRSVAGTPVAIAARDPERARVMAARHGIPTAHDSYEALLADPAVEAVYIALPNHLHVEWVRRAAEAGKHVLVEKPIALHGAELSALDGIDPAIRIAEAFMVRHQPRWQALRRMLESGEHGPVRGVTTSLSFTMAKGDDFRTRPEWGGGAVYDLGCYAAMAARFAFGSEPVRALAECHRDGRGIDLATHAILDFGDGRRAGLAVSFAQAAAQTLLVACERAAIELPAPYVPPPAGRSLIRVDRARDLAAPDAVELWFEPLDQYEAEVTDFSRAVRGAAAPFHGLDDARRNMAVLDAILASARDGGWEAVRRPG
ncbi:MAG: Gfo/Idh/MocA family oxidoreductase [Gluconacetobacter diazotrophicus]|nr:Gfo/Idh/MocA family oxidoreductase [Gluconacetobacter diazotrophicus]